MLPVGMPFSTTKLSTPFSFSFALTDSDIAYTLCNLFILGYKYIGGA